MRTLRPRDGSSSNWWNNLHKISEEKTRFKLSIWLKSQYMSKHNICWHKDQDTSPSGSSMSWESLTFLIVPARTGKKRWLWQRGQEDSKASCFCSHRETELASSHLFPQLMDLRNVRGSCLSHSQRHSQAEPWILPKATFQCIKWICWQVWVMVKRLACFLKGLSIS